MKRITLQAWIERHYGEGSRPSIKTVRRWNDEGKLVPAAQKQGRAYYIPEDARYIDADAPAAGQRTILEAIRGTA